MSTTEVAPERIGRGTPGRRRETPALLAWPDATGALTTYVVLLLGVPAGLVFVFALVIGYVLYSGAHPTDTTPTTTSQRNERPLPPPAANPTPDTATPKQP